MAAIDEAAREVGDRTTTLAGEFLDETPPRGACWQPSPQDSDARPSGWRRGRGRAGGGRPRHGRPPPL